MRELILLLIPVAFAVCLPVCAVMMRRAAGLGLMDEPGGEAHKGHAASVPSVGGLGIAAGVLVPMMGCLFLVMLPQAFWAAVYEPLVVHLEGLQRMMRPAIAVIGALLLIHIIGLIDDRLGMNAWIKLEMQMLFAAVVIVLADVRALQFLDVAYGPVGVLLSAGVTLLWFVVIINAFNMLDNMDGLSGGVAAIITAVYLAALLISGQWFVAAMAALLLGALLGFLVFNFPPAKIFMGDGGSMLVGGLLAIISIRTTYFEPGQAQPGAWYGVLMPLMVMAVPLYDFVSVTLIRTLQGGNPMQADHQHLSHRLTQRGLSRRAAVGVIWACTLATALSGVMLGRLTGPQAVLAGVQTLAVLGVIALLEYGSRAKGVKE